MTRNSNKYSPRRMTRHWMGIAFTLLVNIGLLMIINGLFSMDAAILQSGVLS